MKNKTIRQDRILKLESLMVRLENLERNEKPLKMPDTSYYDLIHSVCKEIIILENILSIK